MLKKCYDSFISGKSFLRSNSGELNKMESIRAHMDEQEEAERVKKDYLAKENALKAEKESLISRLEELKMDPKVREFIELKKRLDEVMNLLPSGRDDVPFPGTNYD